MLALTDTGRHRFLCDLRHPLAEGLVGMARLRGSITCERDRRPCGYSARRGINENEETVIVSPKRPDPVCGHGKLFEKQLPVASCQSLVFNR